MIKLGSLFDGSGGFPLAGALCGITPVWASEIEPFCIRVTQARFPGMKHLGSVTDIDGGKVEPVDIITFGSPCQDLSVAGKQAGIHEGKRSNLFFEAIRIIKEMRDATADKFPRFAVWENVPGAFSSNRGEDFRAVLQSFCEIAGWGGIVPQPPRGKWNHAGAIVGDGWSLAWRMYDAQFWGVPQRRKRIYLIADFGSERAGEILFKPESMRGHPAESPAAGQGAAGDAAGSPGGGHLAFAWANSGSAGLSDGENAPTLKANRNGEPAIAYSIEGHVVDRNTGQNGRGWAAGYAHTLNATDRHAVVCMNDQGGDFMSFSHEVAATLRAQEHGRQPVVCYIPDGNHCGAYKESDKSATLETRYHFGGGGDAALAVYDCRGNGDGGVCPTLTGDHENRVTDYTAVATYIQPSFGEFHQSDIATTLKASDGKRVDPGAVVLEKGRRKRKYIVRRLTPTECLRLQGLPDWWVDGAKGSDSAIYRMCGNGLAIPCSFDVISRLAGEMGGEGNAGCA